MLIIKKREVKKHDKKSKQKRNNRADSETRCKTGLHQVGTAEHRLPKMVRPWPGGNDV